MYSILSITMVSIRNPNKRAGSSSWCNLRSLLIGFVAMQSLNLTVKVIRHVSHEAPPAPAVLKVREEPAVPKPKHDHAPNPLHASRHENHQPKSDKLKAPVERVDETADEKHDSDTETGEDPVVKPHEILPLVVEEEREDREKESPMQPVDSAVLDPESTQVLQKHGTGATLLGYVVDMVQERAHPSFRKLPVSIRPDTAKVASLVGEASVQACESVVAQSNDNPEARPSISQNPHCRDEDTVLVVYNSATFSRRYCGKTIKPGQALKLDQDMDDHCRLELPRVFAVDDPPLDGQGMAPIIVQSKATAQQETALEDSELETVPCSIPCQWEKDISGKDLVIAGTIWQLHQTMDDPYFHDDAKIERTDFRSDKYYSTTSLRSSIPLTFYDSSKHSLRNRPALDWANTANAATYVLNSNCQTQGTRRQKWLAAVQAVFPVAAYGSCQHNTDLAPGETVDTLEGRLALSRKNRIHLAFEAASEKDHLTDVSFEALLSGAVPVLLGPSNANQLFPPHSAIFASDFNKWDALAAYVKEVAENRTLWESYHIWRTDETVLRTWESRWAFAETTASTASPQCRTCRWAYAKEFGLGWNHTAQTIQPTHLPRDLCLDPTSKIVMKPFREYWVQRGSQLEDIEVDTGDGCSKPMSSSTIEMDGYKVEREVSEHDGVVDIVVQSVEKESVNEPVTLRLHVDVRNSEGAYFRNPHTLVSTSRGPWISSAAIQDEFSKVTVLTSWETSVHSPQEGILEVSILKENESFPTNNDGVRRIRVILEDVNMLHDKMTEHFPSSYAKVMIQDFVDPLELFYVSS